MAGNSDPIYTKVADIQSSGPIVTVAATLYDAAGTIGTDVYKVFTADVTNGGFVKQVRVKWVGNVTTTSVAAILKLFISSANTGVTSNVNSFIWDEISLPATGTLATTTPIPSYDIPFNLAIPPGWSILAKITVAQVNRDSGWQATAIAGKY